MIIRCGNCGCESPEGKKFCIEKAIERLHKAGQQATQRSANAEAHLMLSEIYNRFTEGFDTKDLQEVKALIEELSN